MRHFQTQNTLVECGFVIIKFFNRFEKLLYWSKPGSGEEHIVILRLIKIMKFLLLIIVTARPHCLIVLKVMGNKESYYVGVVVNSMRGPIYSIFAQSSVFGHCHSSIQCSNLLKFKYDNFQFIYY